MDTAGIRETEDVVEKIGVSRAREVAKGADLVLYVVDSSTPLDENDEEIIEYLTERILSHRIDYKLSSNANVWVEDAGNISDFLEGVMVHPSAPEWYVNIVQDICLQKGIHFDGQSQIYKLK